MIWLSWRQLRTNAAIMIGVLVGAMLMWLLTRPQQDAVTGHILDEHHLVQLLNNGIALLPVVIGAFWGAPLVARELETGTHRLVWTQSVSPTRWLATKVALVGSVGLLAAAVASAGVDWWWSPLDSANGNRFAAGNFGMRGIVPVAYTAFAFALGVLVGVVLRRTVAAVATTMAVFLAVRIAVTQWVRPHFLHAVTTTRVTPLGRGGRPDPGTGSVTNAGDWVLSFRGIGRDGFSTETVTFQPAHRFWEFQWIESGLFVGAAVVFLAAAFWWVRHRVR